MKKFLLLILTLAICLSMCACGTALESSNSSFNNSSNSSSTSSSSKPSKNSSSSYDNGNDVSITAPEEKPAKKITAKSTVSSATAEFYIDYANITKDVVPPKPASFYTHYEAESGKVFVDLCIAYKNKDTSAIRADKVISATLTYDNAYEYTGFSTIEKNSRSSFTYTNITNIAPLSTEYIHYLFSVPEEVKSNNKSVKIEFTIDDVKYVYSLK